MIEWSTAAIAAMAFSVFKDVISATGKKVLEKIKDAVANQLCERSERLWQRIRDRFGTEPTLKTMLAKYEETPTPESAAILTEALREMMENDPQLARELRTACAEIKPLYDQVVSAGNLTMTMGNVGNGSTVVQAHNSTVTIR